MNRNKSRSLGPVVLGSSRQVHRSSHCLCVWWELSSAEYQKKHFNFIQVWNKMDVKPQFYSSME